MGNDKSFDDAPPQAGELEDSRYTNNHSTWSWMRVQPKLRSSWPRYFRHVSPFPSISWIMICGKSQSYLQHIFYFMVSPGAHRREERGPVRMIDATRRRY